MRSQLLDEAQTSGGMIVIADHEAAGSCLTRQRPDPVAALFGGAARRPSWDAGFVRLRRCGASWRCRYSRSKASGVGFIRPVADEACGNAATGRSSSVRGYERNLEASHSRCGFASGRPARSVTARSCVPLPRLGLARLRAPLFGGNQRAVNETFSQGQAAPFPQVCFRGSEGRRQLGQRAPRSESADRSDTRESGPVSLAWTPERRILPQNPVSARLRLLAARQSPRSSWAWRLWAAADR